MTAKPAPCMRSGSCVLEKRPGFSNQGSSLPDSHNRATRASKAAANEMPVLSAVPVYGTTVPFHTGREEEGEATGAGAAVATTVRVVALLHVSLLQEYGAAATAVTIGAYSVVLEVLETSNAKTGEFRETTAVAVIVLRLVVVKVIVDGVANTASAPAESVIVAPAGQIVV